MVYTALVMSTKLTFFKSYRELGWWAARVPVGSDWAGHEIEVLGFGVTQTQAERDLARKEQARFEAFEPIAA